MDLRKSSNRSSGRQRLLFESDSFVRFQTSSSPGTYIPLLYYSISVGRSLCRNSLYCIITSRLPCATSSPASSCGCSPISRLFKHVCNSPRKADALPVACSHHRTWLAWPRIFWTVNQRTSFWIYGNLYEHIRTGPEA